jgi:hypothetical protein
MIGRGSRRLPNKENFTLIDLGNNVRRFGYWQDFINWQDAFRFPDRFLESRLSAEDDLQFEVEFELPHYVVHKVDEAILQGFSMKDTDYALLDQNEKGKKAVDLSAINHAKAIHAKNEDIYDALDTFNLLQDHVEHRLKQYTKCIAKSTPNYFKYLMETYSRQVRQELRSMYD